MICHGTRNFGSARDHVRRLCQAIAFVLMTCALTAPAAAQVVNIQAVLTEDPPEGFSGGINGSADWRTGNVELFFITGNALLEYRKDRHIGLAILRGDHKTSSGDTILSRTFAHLRYRYLINDWLTFELFGQHAFDEIRRLRTRALTGIGPKIDLVDGEVFDLSVGVAYMFEYENLQEDMELDAGDINTFHRLSSYLIAHLKIDERLSLAETVYAQPTLDNFNDVRVLSETQFIVKITEHFTYSNSLNVAYDSRPPLSIEKLDTGLMTSVGLHF